MATCTFSADVAAGSTIALGIVGNTSPVACTLACRTLACSVAACSTCGTLVPAGSAVVGVGFEVSALTRAKSRACGAGAGSIGTRTVGTRLSTSSTVDLAGFEIEAASGTASLVGLASTDTTAAGSVGTGSSTTSTVIGVCENVHALAIAKPLTCRARTLSVGAGPIADGVALSAMLVVGPGIHTDAVAQLPIHRTQALTLVTSGSCFASIATGSAMFVASLQAHTLSVAQSFTCCTSPATSSRTGLVMGTGDPTSSAVSEAGLEVDAHPIADR